MDTWSIADTRKRVGAKFGPAQVELMRNCLRSVCERQRHARYHYQEARRLMVSHIDDRTHESNIFQIICPTHAEERVAFDACFMAVEAHVIACAQAIHAIADNLAHVAYFSFGVNQSSHKLQDHLVTLNRVTTLLEKHFPKAKDVADCLTQLRNNSAFQIVDAFVNTTKHRGYTETCINVSPAVPEAQYALEFGCFAYRDVQHPNRDIESVLVPAYDAASVAVVGCGIAINLASTEHSS